MKYLPAFAAAVVAFGVGFGVQASAADVAHGETLYAECKGCHSLRDNLVGPRHCWVAGRPAGKVPDFDYSEVMKSSRLVWDDKTLDEFLTMPFVYLSGTKMGYAGLPDKSDRDDLIAYLKQVTSDPATCDGVDKLH